MAENLIESVGRTLILSEVGHEAVSRLLSENEDYKGLSGIIDTWVHKLATFVAVEDLQEFFHYAGLHMETIKSLEEVVREVAFKAGFKAGIRLK